MTLTIICALAKNRVIGKDNKLIWHISEDLKRFKNLTTGHPIIMGRKTFESLPGLLPGRTHYVLTGNENYRAPVGVILCRSAEELLQKLPDTDCYIIGGAAIYKTLLPYADAMELTEIEKPTKATLTFLNFPKKNGRKQEGKRAKDTRL